MDEKEKRLMEDEDDMLKKALKLSLIEK